MKYDWLQLTVFENSVDSIIRFTIILLSAILLKRFVSNQFSSLLYRFIKGKVSGVRVHELRELLKKPFGLFIILTGLYFAAQELHYPESWHLVNEDTFGLRLFIWKTFQLMMMVSITWMLMRLVDFFGIVLLQRAQQTLSKADDQLVPFIKESIKFIVMLLCFFICLGSVFHVNVASLIAGLGIGGIAIALAAKDTLENLLGSFTIFLDKPFTLGDTVKVGNSFGKIERIGFRSTQIRTQDKTLITVPNKKMIDMELENISMRNMMKALFPLTLQYGDKPEKTEAFIADALSYLKGREDMISDPEPSIRVDKLTEAGVELHFQFFLNTIDQDEFATKKTEILLHILQITQSHSIRLEAGPKEVIVRK